MFTLKQLQEEHAPWQLHNFGPQAAYRPLLGIIEEFGELDGAVNDAEIKDGLADAIVFMAHFCNEMKFEFDDIAAHAKCLTFRPDPPTRELGRLAHSFLKKEQGIRGTDAEHRLDIHNCLVRLYAILLGVASKHGWNLIDLVEETWSRVRLRDWKRDATRGGEAAP